MRSDWDKEFVARKGKNAEGQKRLPQFTLDELTEMEAALVSFKYAALVNVLEPHRQRAATAALVKVRDRLSEMGIRRGHS